MKKIGLFFGSFNPIHIGHLAVGNYLCEFHGLDELWLVVTPQNPLKESAILVAAEHRLAMAHLATEAYPKFRVCDIEFRLPQPTYTIHTLDALRVQHPQHEFYLVIGADNWQQLPQWHDYQRLYTDYKILVYPRFGYEIDIPATHYPNVRLTKAPRIELSSTLLRTAINESKNISYLTLQSIYKYIKIHNLYLNTDSNR